ncbi:MAG: cytochrome c-type biogenesis CcmF C-terminal domain-containing protein, partial [Gammaproteobacteria bacterium]
GVFKNWTVLLAISAFSLSLLGAFLVRSGVLTSVHAFATDPARGIFILVLLGIVIGGSLFLYALRAPGMGKSNSFALVSRETLLLINSVLLCVATAAVFLGTIYPLVVEALGLGKLSVGEPYFNAVFVPLMAPVAIAVAIGMIARWRSDELARIWRHLRLALIGSLVLGILLVAMLAETFLLRTVIGLILALWVIFATIISFREKTRNSGGMLKGLGSLPLGYIGMSLAHIGFAVTIIGISVTSQYSTEVHKRMGAGDTEEFAGYVFRLDEIREVDGPNYSATEGLFSVHRDSRQLFSLSSEKRRYPVAGSTMTEAGIDGGLFRDLYVSLGEPLDDNDWSVRLYHRPFVRWIWLGAIFMALGGVVAASDKRYRVKVAQSRADTTVSDAVAARA